MALSENHYQGNNCTTASEKKHIFATCWRDENFGQDITQLLVVAVHLQGGFQTNHFFVQISEDFTITNANNINFRRGF